MPAFAAMLRVDAEERAPAAGIDRSNVSSTETLHYRRSHFVTRLPVGHLYAPSHAWLAPAPEGPVGRWRVGLTKFALRMLGELVELQFSRNPGDPVQPGDVIGSIEGFKALSDLYCVGSGRFAEGNPAVLEAVEQVSRDPYRAGWLYAFDGEPDGRTLDVQGYRQLLDETIDRIMAREKQADAH
jgi:glycine cleavage system H protein